MEDYRSPKSYRIPYLHSLKGSLVLSLTTEPRLSHGGDFLSIYSGAPTRAHTLTQVHQGEGRGKRRAPLGLAHFPATPYSLRSTVSHLDISGGFHNLTVLSEKSTI